MSAKQAIEEIFTKPLAERIWTANTLMVLPLTPQNVAVGSVLPAVFYMFRRGYRRGQGEFQTTFSPPGAMRPTISSVAVRLSQDARSFTGFDSGVRREILGDLLLCDALENKGHAEGQDVEIQRAFPVHFFSSWLDLPPSVGHLRYVPEMLVALLANQPAGLKLQPSSASGEFCVGTRPEQNTFFRVFAKGVQFGANPANLSGDRIDEDAQFSVEEVLMIRLAQECGQAPERLRTAHGASPEIQNLCPTASVASATFREDIASFLREYGETIPRRAVTPMLESMLGLGLLQVFLGSLDIVVAWDRNGCVPEPALQHPVAMLVDCSCGIDARLRDLSEQSVEEIVRLVDQANPALMAVRILDASGRDDPDLRGVAPSGPDARAWLDTLGKVRRGQHEASALLLRDLKIKMNRLADRLQQDGIESDAVDALRSGNVARDCVGTLAETLCLLMGEKILRGHYLTFLDSCLMVNEPNGLGRKRRLYRTLGGKRRMTDARSVVLSNTLLEALVHRHLAGRDGTLYYAEFLRILKDRYGLCIDVCPPGVAATQEDLSRNRAVLERRLRDLGLLHGVNDAESMKHLRGRFRAKERG